MKIVAIVQARINSTRLPGKVMFHVSGKPLLEFLIERIKKSKKLNDLIIATGTNSDDDEIETLCKDLNVKCFRGSDNDVLLRYNDAAKFVSADVIVRLTGDNVVIDPNLIDNAITFFLNHDYDYVSTCCPLPRTYPEGYTVEIFSKDTLQKLNDTALKPSDREHVTFSLWMEPNKYNVFRLDLETDLSHYRLTMDYPSDFKVIRSLFEELYPKKPDFTLEDVISWLDKNPQIASKNSEIKPNQGWKPAFNEDKKEGY